MRRFQGAPPSTASWDAGARTPPPAPLASSVLLSPASSTVSACARGMLRPGLHWGVHNGGLPRADCPPRGTGAVCRCPRPLPLVPGRSEEEEEEEEEEATRPLGSGWPKSWLPGPWPSCLQRVPMSLLDEPPKHFLSACLGTTQIAHFLVLFNGFIRRKELPAQRPWNPSTEDTSPPVLRGRGGARSWVSGLVPLKQTLRQD